MSARTQYKGVWILALVFFLSCSGYLLWTEHKAHIIEFLPWLILLLCPLMHLFMHRHHGGHGGGESGGNDTHSHHGRDHE